MADTLDITIPEDDQAQLQKLVSMWTFIPREDRAVLLSYANVFRVRSDIERAVQNQQDEPPAGST